MQALPNQFEGLLREVLATRHRWGGQHPVGIVRRRRGLNLNDLGIFGEMAQLGELAIGKLSPEADRRGAVSINLLSR